MTAPILPDPDVAAGVVRFEVDHDAESGDVVPALAALLIGGWRRRREAEQAADGNATNMEV